jgi:hypothetical protein
MQKQLRNSSPLVPILVGVAVLAIVGLVTWRIVTKVKTSNNSSAQQTADAPCDYDDKDLCKFFATHKAHDTYKVNGISTLADGTKTTTIFETQGTDKTHVTTTAEGVDLDIITIGSVTYTKASDDTWWKQTKPQDAPSDEYADDYQADLKEPESSTPDGQKIEYKKIGTETCGDLQCFKYQVVDPGAPEQEQFTWFDAKDYQLRRQTIKDAEGSNDMTFIYTGVSIGEPSPVKELGPNQILAPGQAEPSDAPNADL